MPEIFFVCIPGFQNRGLAPVCYYFFFIYNELISTRVFQKITGSQALAWLGMDSSSDEDESSNKRVDDFFGKEHFDGKSGEKVRML